MASVPPEILEKIKKCLALTKSTFEAEADTALSMANKLMEQWGVTMAEVDMADGHIKDGSIKEAETKERDMWPWEKELARVIKYLMAVEYFYRLGYKKRTVVFVGTESDSALAVQVYDILRAELKRISRDEPTPADRRSFLTGCVDMLNHRAGIIYRERNRAAAAKARNKEPAPVTGTDLIVVKQNDVKEYMSQNYKLSPDRSRGSSVNGDSYARGTAAGRSMSLSFNKALK